MKPRNRIWFLQALLLLAFGYTRFHRLDLLPPFTDEVNYLRWCHLVSEGYPFVPLTADGKQPLFVWLGRLVIPFFDDPLLGLRALSAALGLLTAIGVVIAARRLAIEEPEAADRCATVALLLYVVSPYALFYERLALYDSLVNALGIGIYTGSLGLTGAGGGRRRWAYALFVGMLAGLALISKIYAVLFLLYPLLAAAGSSSRGGWQGIRAFLWEILLIEGMAIGIFLAVNAGAWVQAGGIPIHTRPFALAHRHPIPHLAANLRFLGEVALFFVTPGYLLLLLVGIGLWRFVPHGVRLLLLPVGLALLVVVGAATSLFPRYLLLTLPLLVLFCAFVLVAGTRRWRGTLCWGGMVVFLLLPPLLQDRAILTWPQRAHLPSVTRFQYIEGWPSGYGTRELFAFLEARARKGGPIDLFTTPEPGNVRDALANRFGGDPRFRLHLAPRYREVPILPEARGVVAEVGTEPYLPERRERIVFDELERVYFVGNAPKEDLGAFLRRNPQGKIVFFHNKPGGKSALFVARLR